MTTSHNPAFVDLSEWITNQACPFVRSALDHPNVEKTPRTLRITINPAPTCAQDVIRSLATFHLRTIETFGIPTYDHHTHHQKLAILAQGPVFLADLGRLMLPFLHAIARPSPLALNFGAYQRTVTIRRLVEHDNPLPFTTPEHIKRATLLLNTPA